MFHHRVVQRFTKLSETEQYICQQLVQMQNKITTCGIVTLAKRCHTSPATLFRTIKALGYDGFTEFKYDFFQKPKIVPENLSNGIQDVWKVMHRTEKILNDIVYEKLPTNEKQTVYICGSGVIQRQAGRELERQLKGSRYVVESISDAYEWEKIKEHIKSDDIAVLISLSGENQILLDMMSTFRVSSTYVIAICLNGINELSKVATTVVPYIMPENMESILPLYMAIEYVAEMLKMNK
ncbi:MAG: MurR/RpiR family transcriptional regulator [Culicoidibacterales bacterium]